MADKGKKSSVPSVKYESNKLVDSPWRRKDEGKDEKRISSTR